MTRTSAATALDSAAAADDGLRRLLSRAGAIATVHRIVLGALLAFGALNAFGGGYYAMSGAPGVPREWLAGTPFSDYSVPGLILFIAVGGSFAFAAVAVFLKNVWAKRAAVGAGVVVLGWITAQVALIGFVSWLQPATAITGGVILALALLLPRRA